MPDQLPPAAPAVSVPPANRRRFLVIAVVLLAVIVIVGVTVWWRRGVQQPRSIPTASTFQPGVIVPITPVTYDQDPDGDGLLNDQEQQQGTDGAKADTDGAGLRDGEEVAVYLTDPKNPDTDGDGVKDGEEIRNGYDPKGPGRFGALRQ